MAVSGDSANQALYAPDRGHKLQVFYSITTLRVGLALLSVFSVFSLAAVAAALDLSFAWDANKDHVEGYRLYSRENGQPYDDEEPAWEGSVTDTSCTVFNLDADGVYYFVLRAYNAYGESKNSVELRYPPASRSSGGGGGCMISASTVRAKATPLISGLLQ